MSLVLMIMIAVVVGLLLIGVGVWFFSKYNQLIRLNREVDEAWADIDVLLKQRSDELPKLLDTVQEYMEYEQETYQKVVEARNMVQKASNPKEQGKADSMLKGALEDLFALSEDYPDLKASENFQQLQDRISSIEERIADRREYYNETANNWNVRKRQVPEVLVVKLVKSFSGKDWSDRDLYEVSEEDRQDVDVGAAFDNN